MQFIFSTGSLYTYGIDRCFELAAQAGFDGVEIMIDHRWDTRQAEHLHRLTDQSGQPVVAIHSPFTARVPGWPADEPGRIRESVKLAEAVGAKVVVHHLPPRVGWHWIRIGRRRWPVPALNQHLPARYRRWLMEEYQDFQASTPVVLCIENMPARQWLGRPWSGHQWNNAKEMRQFPNQTMDTTHLGTWGLDPNEIYGLVGQRVKHVHLSNFDGHEHRRPEDGHLPLDRFLGQLVEDGYQGAVSLELHPDALDAGKSDTRVIELLTHSLTLCRQWAAAKRSQPV